MYRVEEVLERIKAAGLKLKPEKCLMLQKEVIFLGHVVSGEGVKTSLTNITKIMSWPKPQTAKQIKQLASVPSKIQANLLNADPVRSASRELKILCTASSTELIAAQDNQSAETQIKAGESKVIKALAEASELGPSSPDATKPEEVKQGSVSTTWASTRSTEDLRRCQREDPDIATILKAKMAGKKPSSQEMVTCSPATRHY